MNKKDKASSELATILSKRITRLQHTVMQRDLLIMDLQSLIKQSRVTEESEGCKVTTTSYSAKQQEVNPKRR